MRKIWTLKRGRLLYIQNMVVCSVKTESHDLLVIKYSSYVVLELQGFEIATLYIFLVDKSILLIRSYKILCENMVLLSI